MQSHRDASNDFLWTINCLSHQEKQWYQRMREINTTLLVYIGDSDTTMPCFHGNQSRQGGSNKLDSLTVEDLPGITASIRSSQSQWEFQEECQHFKAHKESSIPNLKNGVLLS